MPLDTEILILGATGAYWAEESLLSPKKSKRINLKDLMTSYRNGGFFNHAYHDTETLEIDRRFVFILYYNICFCPQMCIREIFFPEKYRITICQRMCLWRSLSGVLCVLVVRGSTVKKRSECQASKWKTSFNRIASRKRQQREFFIYLCFILGWFILVLIFLVQDLRSEDCGWLYESPRVNFSILVSAVYC